MSAQRIAGGARAHSLSSMIVAAALVFCVAFTVSTFVVRAVA